MEYHELKLMLEQPALKLLRAQNAPMLLGFLYQTFKREHKITVPEGQLRATLDSYLDELRQQDPQAYPKSAAEYLADWCSKSQGFLRRYYGRDANEHWLNLKSSAQAHRLRIAHALQSCRHNRWFAAWIGSGQILDPKAFQGDQCA
jgi:hypothetical protein